MRSQRYVGLLDATTLAPPPTGRRSRAAVTGTLVTSVLVAIAIAGASLAGASAAPNVQLVHRTLANAPGTTRYASQGILISEPHHREMVTPRRAASAIASFHTYFRAAPGSTAGLSRSRAEVALVTPNLVARSRPGRSRLAWVVTQRDGPAVVIGTPVMSGRVVHPPASHCTSVGIQRLRTPTWEFLQTCS